MRWNLLVSCGLALLVALIAPAGASADGGEWEWELTPFLWASDISLNLSVNDTDVANVEVDFSDLVDKLDLGALVHFEGRRGRGGFLLEVSYIELSDDKTITGRPPVADGTMVHTGLTQLIAEAGGFVEVFGKDSGFDLLFGARLFDLSVDVDFVFPVAPDKSLASDESLVDGFAGLRYRGGIGERWIWWARGDVGAGGTDLSWQGIFGVGLKIGKKGDDALWFGYRHLEFDLKGRSSGITDTELAYSGPIFGYRFGF